jgi:hypothetical protein
MDVSFDVKNISFSSRKFMTFLFRYSRPFLLFVFFLVFGYGLFVWYENAYRNEWSEAEKQSYALSAFQETVFREDAFDQVIQYVQERAQQHEDSVTLERDYFFPVSD